MVGLVLGIFVGVLPGSAGRTASPSCCRSPSRWIRLGHRDALLHLLGALFGGAITSILFNIPGEAWSVATTFDGYPMAQQGKAAEALTAAFTSSFIGSLVAVLLITFLAPGSPPSRCASGRRSSSRLFADLLLVCRARARGEAQDHHLHDARLLLAGSAWTLSPASCA